METLESVLKDHEEETCPICKRPLFMTEQPDGSSRFEGCGRGCAPMYSVPENSIIFGLKGGPMTVYRKRWNPNEPSTKVAKYTNGGW